MEPGIAATGIRDKRLKDRILEEIAISFPFPLEEVKAVYETTLSIDKTISVCEAACMLGVGNLYAVAGLWR